MAVYAETICTMLIDDRGVVFGFILKLGCLYAQPLVS